MDVRENRMATKARDRWRELKRRELLTLAVELIHREGLESLTMEGVAAAAGVAKGTVYLYFDSKDRLVEQAIEKTLEPLVEEVCGLLESERVPEEKLRSMAIANLAYFDRHRSLFRVFTHDRYARRTHTRRSRDDHYRKVVGKTAEVIRDGIRQRRFRAADADTTAAIWLEALTVVLVRRLQAADSGPAEAAADSLLELFFYGLLLPDAG